MPAGRPAGLAGSGVVRKCPWLRRVLAPLQGECQPCTLRSPRSPGEAVQLKVLRDPIDDDKFHDECGVFGVLGHAEAANITYLGIHALQHRGQESAGIAALDAGQIQVHKTMGLVADNFDAATLARLPGNAAMGHTRYSTAGQSRIENAQPFVFKGVAGPIAVAHNGNLVNAEELRAALETQGAIFTGSSDTELLLHLIAREREGTAVERIQRALAQGRGAYSLLFLTQHSIIAVRDPLGFRPLVPGKGVAGALGSPRQGGIAADLGLSRSNYVGCTFVEPSQSIRHFGVKLKLNPVQHVVKGKRVVVVDDSIVRGTTSRKIVKMLRDAGARQVHLRISAPPTRWPCYYGIDTPVRSELIAATHTVDEIAKYVTADSLGYLSEKGMHEAVRAEPRTFCDACFTGEYLVELMPPVEADRRDSSAR